MHIPGRKLLVKAFRWTRSRLEGGVLILGYHRLGDTADDPFDLCVRPSDFAQHLEVLGGRARALTLGHAARALAAGTIPPRAVVVTFDDGYADTLTQVLPLLERTGTPATIFVTTGARGRQFWWDELADILLRPRALPPRLELALQGTRRSWTFAAGSREPSGENTRSERHLALHALAGELRLLDGAARDEVLEVLRQWSGHRPVASAHRSLTPAQIRELSRSPLVEIGAHTVSHPVLTQLSEAEQQAEVAASRAELEETTGTPVTSFSYPHGAYSATTIAAVRRAGFAAACCSTPDVVTKKSDVLALPRMWIQPHDPERFARWLDRWLVA
jgi:peptidoglycan/xylan/chitin deacetylase (PgdA/CDA1 family)